DCKGLRVARCPDFHCVRRCLLGLHSRQYLSGLTNKALIDCIRCICLPKRAKAWTCSPLTRISPCSVLPLRNSIPSWVISPEIWQRHVPRALKPPECKPISFFLRNCSSQDIRRKIWF